MSPALRVGAAVIGLALLGGYQLVLDVAPLESPPDASPPDAGTVDALDLCGEADGNDTLATASVIGDSGTVTAAVCLGNDQDFYAITVAAKQDLNVLLTFSPDDERNLDLELYQRATETLIEISSDADGDEQIARTLAAGNRLEAGQYGIRVFDRTGAGPTNYELSWGPAPLTAADPR